MLVVAAMHASNDDIALDQRIVHVPPSPARPGAGRTDPPQFLRFGEEFCGTVPYAASVVSMSARASLGSAYILATVPGTARLIFPGHDGSASGDSSRIVKLIARLQLAHLAGWGILRI